MDSLGTTLGGPEGLRLSSLIAMLHEWHNKDIGCLPVLLQTIGLLPFISLDHSTSTSVGVDGTLIMDSLNALTASAKRTASDASAIWAEGLASRLSYAMVRTNVGIDVDDIADRQLPTSVCGISLAAELYLCCVLEIWNGGEPVDDRLVQRLATALSCSLAHANSDRDSDAFLWETLVGAYSVAKHLSWRSDESSATLLPRFVMLMRQWSQKSEIIDWATVKQKLRSLAWPLYAMAMTEESWNNAFTA